MEQKAYAIKFDNINKIQREFGKWKERMMSK